MVLCGHKRGHWRSTRKQSLLNSQVLERSSPYATWVIGGGPGFSQVAKDRSEGKALGQSLYWGFCGIGMAEETI